MQVDFWQLSRDPAETVVAQIAERAMAGGHRLLVVTADAEQAESISQALWRHKPEGFLAHGQAGETGAARQPILISADLEPENGATHVIFADGEWRDPPGDAERVFLLFGEATIAAARQRWKALPAGERSFWRQDESGWTKVA